MLKDQRSDQLLAMINPGMMLWAPKEYDMFRLCEPGMSEALLYRYLIAICKKHRWRKILSIVAGFTLFGKLFPATFTPDNWIARCSIAPRAN